MELKILGSSSAGNCYILENNNEALVIEAGVSLKEVMQAIDFNISKIVGVLVTHEHGDHAKYINGFMQNRINVYSSDGTFRKSGFSVKSRFQNEIEALKPFKVGGFQVLPFNVMHDAENPFGFLIDHEETGGVLFVTDSYYIPYKFNNLSNILIEANYRTDILQKQVADGKVPKRLLDRTLEAHMSFETCMEALKANDLSKVNNIVLIHLSDRNSNAIEFERDAKEATGKTVWIADKGLTIPFNKTPF